MSEGQGLRTKSELTQRVISASVLAAAAIGVAWYGGPLFALVWIALAAAVAFEWFTVVGVQRAAAMAVPLAVVLAAAVAVMHYLGNWASVLPVSALVLLYAGFVDFAGGSDHRGWAAGGVVYAALLGLCTVLVRGQWGWDGFVAILFLFAVVWMTDIGAYFAGRRFGGPKFAPRISPKKTWSGVAGGMVAGVAVSVAVLALAGTRPGFSQFLIALILSISVVFGDLFESYIKRRFGVKDAGALIPGHGGFMDRLDGYIVAVVLAAMIGIWRGGWDSAASGLLR